LADAATCRRKARRAVGPSQLTHRAELRTHVTRWHARCLAREWQVRQAEQALRIYFVNFLNRADWHRQPASGVVDDRGGVDPVAALQQLRARVRTRHYSHRTESSYADWVRRFLEHLAKQQGVAHPSVAAESVRDYLTHLAVRQGVSASTQNQAFLRAAVLVP
jgi:Phage integrase, N-terminal SAM-like domain